MPVIAKSGILTERLMHRAVWMLVLGFSMVCTLYAQESSKNEVRDTLVKKPVINQSLIRSLYTDTILPSSMRSSHEYIPMSLHEALTNIPSSLSGQFQQQIDLVSPWKQELAKQNELRTIKTILGALQAGGTAFLLYEHIKKYGVK